MNADLPKSGAADPRPTAAGTPLANVLTDGFLGKIPRVPENLAAVNEREKMWFHTLCPRNDFHAWLVEDIARMTLRLERVARIERRERDRIALRAEFFWDDDRRLDAEELGRRLEVDPAGTVERLKKTPHGCDWMMRKWALLAHAADRNGAWTEAQAALAFDLLATPEGFRDGTPGRVVGPDGRAEDGGIDPASVARREVAALREHRLAVADADALDRALARSDMSDAATNELRRLRRYEASLHKRLRWCLRQLQEEPRHKQPNPNLVYLFEVDEPKPEPSATVEPSAYVAEPALKPPPEPDPAPAPEAVAVVEDAPAPVPARHRDPFALKAEARRQAKKRRADRLDN